MTPPRYAAAMRMIPLALLLTWPAFAPAFADGGHDGLVRPRSAPEPSDVALFLLAAMAVWFTRRALRRRAAAGRLPRD